MCSILSIINIMYFIHGIYSGYTQKEKEFHLVDHHYHNYEKFTLLTGIQLFIIDALMYSTNTLNFVTSISIWFHTETHYQG
jgi:hypothetical protein